MVEGIGLTVGSEADSEEGGKRTVTLRFLISEKYGNGDAIY